MDVIVNIFYVNIFIFTEWFPMYPTYKRKLNFNRLVHESKNSYIRWPVYIYILFDLTNSA